VGTGDSIRIEPRRGGTSPHTFSKNHIHAVFSTKDREKIIQKEIQPRLWGYMASIGRNHGMTISEIGGVEDHVHLLFHLPPSLALARAITLFKSNSSKWINQSVRKFAWQEGYGAFSVSASNLTAVVRYIQNQEVHHRKISFENEYLALLKKHGVEFDPKYFLG
jgi:putative transposase